MVNVLGSDSRAGLPDRDGDRTPGVVVYSDTGGIDAIDEYSRRLVKALCEIGAPARYVPDGVASLSRTRRRPPWILLQYNPLSYGRWGFAPMLVRYAMAMCRRTDRFILSVHEPWVEIDDWRSAIMGGYHRVQLLPLLAMADGIITMTESLASTLRRGAVPIPVGTTITPVGGEADLARKHFELRDRFVVALFGRAHPSRALDYAEHAISELAVTSAGRRLTVMNLGESAPDLALPSDVDVRTLGGLDPAELSLALRASDLLLLPFTDGVSARRTTLMAALAHGVPVVGLRGRNTDRVLLAPDALVLTPAGDRVAFARAVVALATSDARLRAIGNAGRRLYLERFDWPLVARAVFDVVTPSR